MTASTRGPTAATMPAPAPAPARGAPASLDPAPAGDVILVVDDDPLSLFMMGELCELLGLEAELVESGTRCLERLAANPGRYRLILLDMHMPRLPGSQVTRTIRALAGNPPRDIPIIATTADTSWADAERRGEIRLDGYLPKPVRSAAVRSLMEVYAA